jgi:broad specificity phosphatase PhoE
MAEQKWPQVLWIVRHGQSAGNVAREAAEAAAHPLIDITTRDVDTPLSALGERQSLALGRWFGAMPVQRRPTRPNSRLSATSDCAKRNSAFSTA